MKNSEKKFKSLTGLTPAQARARVQAINGPKQSVEEQIAESKAAKEALRLKEGAKTREFNDKEKAEKRKMAAMGRTPEQIESDRQRMPNVIMAKITSIDNDTIMAKIQWNGHKVTISNCYHRIEEFDKALGKGVLVNKLVIPKKGMTGELMRPADSPLCVPTYILIVE